MARFLPCLIVLLSLEPVGIGQEKSQPGKRDENREAIEKFMKSFNEPIRIRESKPVIVNDAQFVVVSQADWKPATPHKVFPMVAPIEIQLRITNLGKKDVLFPTFHTFGITITNAVGKEVKPRSVRKGNTFTRPVLLPRGTSHTLCLRGEIRWDEKTKASELVYFDRTGSQSSYGPLEPGRYKLVFRYGVPRDKEELKERKIGEPPSWIGEVFTEPVLVEVVVGTIRGACTGGEQEVEDFTKPLRVRESKAVTLNDAKFVVVAQADWKPGNYKTVPIDIQLRITNLAKREIIFPTFDTFGLRIINGDGKMLMPRGGRNGTRLTRPLLIPAGASYSLGPEGGTSLLVGRRAELRWNSRTKAAELLYYDGTGTVNIFGPLKTGSYKLVYWFRVGSNGPSKTNRETSTWLGSVVTEEVVIEVLDP